MIAPQPRSAGDPGRAIVGVGFLVVVAVALALIALGLDRPAEDVTIRELWLRPEAYDGRHVSVQGTLRVFLAGAPLQHYAVEDALHHRVGISGVDQSRLDQLVGRPVNVAGVLRISPLWGILIEVTTIEEPPP
ncbi:MAG: hypothetical protein V9F06_02665 [Thermomicrobiales bacterium]